MAQLGDGKKKPKTTSGAPYPPAVEHSDGPAERPRHDVPTAGESDEPDETEREEEDDG